MGIKNFIRSIFGVEKKSTKDKSKTSSSSSSLAPATKTTKFIKEQIIEVESQSDLNKLTSLGPAMGVVLEPVTVWKAVEEGIVKLTLPKATQIVASGAGQKLRADRAEVEGVFGGDPGGRYEYEMSRGRSFHDPSFTYAKGDTVAPREGFDDDPTKTCGSGIHFYATKKFAKMHHERQTTQNRTRNCPGLGHTRRSRGRLRRP